MKNFKLFSKSIEKNKLKLVKIKGTAYLILMTTALSVVPSKTVNATNNDSYIETNLDGYEVETFVESLDLNYSNGNSNNASNNTKSNNVSVDKASVNNFISKINKITTNYDYQEVFETSEAVKEMDKIKFDSNIEHSRDFLNGSKEVDYKELYELVLDNNKKYQKENDNSLYKKFSKKELKKFCEQFASAINFAIKENDSIDLDELSCNLADLKIFEKNTTDVAHMTPDNCLIISEFMFKLMEKTSGNKNAGRNTLMHEAVHLIQASCEHIEQLNPGKNMGISYRFENKDYNIFDLAWIYEGSAEKNVVNMTGDEPLYYKNYVNYVDSLNFVTMLDKKNGANETEKLDLQKDFKKVYEQFEAMSNKDKVELVNMLASINVIQVEPADFVEKYFNVYGKKLDSLGDDKLESEAEFEEVKLSLKASSMETLTKIFYKNLAEVCSNSNVTIQDAFYLIKTFENDVYLHILYDDKEKVKYNEEYINNYVDIQDEFFYLLSQSKKYSQKDIETLFDKYSMFVEDKNKDKVPNCTLKWLDKDKVDFITDFSTADIRSGRESIRETQQTLYNKNR